MAPDGHLHHGFNCCSSRWISTVYFYLQRDTPANIAEGAVLLRDQCIAWFGRWRLRDFQRRRFGLYDCNFRNCYFCNYDCRIFFWLYDLGLYLVTGRWLIGSVLDDGNPFVSPSGERNNLHDVVERRTVRDEGLLYLVKARFMGTDGVLDLGELATLLLELPLDPREALAVIANITAHGSDLVANVTDVCTDIAPDGADQARYDAC